MIWMQLVNFAGTEMKESSWKPKESPQTSIQLKVQGYGYEHDFAPKKDKGDEKGDPKYFSVKGVIPHEKNHRQNAQPKKAQGIDQNQKPSCKMNPQGHGDINHRIFGEYSTSIRKGCAGIALRLEYAYAFWPKPSSFHPCGEPPGF